MAIYNYSPTSICDHLSYAITISHKRLACDRLESFRSIKQFESKEVQKIMVFPTMNEKEIIFSPSFSAINLAMNKQKR